MASVKNKLNKIMGRTEKESISRRFKSEGERKPESCSNVHEQKKDKDWKLVRYTQHTPKTTRVQEESKMSQKQLVEAIKKEEEVKRGVLNGEIPKGANDGSGGDGLSSGDDGNFEGFY
mgnify:CR=1 FL=1